jgi:single-strand DNA-binding protein
MPNYNQATIIGHVGRDPETRFTADGKPICNFSIAYTDKYGGKEKTTWFKCSAFGKQAEVIQQYVTKGVPLMVQGQVTLNEWKDKDGGNRADLSSAVRDFTMLGGKGERNEEAATTKGKVHHAPNPMKPDFDEQDIPF